MRAEAVNMVVNVVYNSACTISEDFEFLLAHARVDGMLFRGGCSSPNPVCRNSQNIISCCPSTLYPRMEMAAPTNQAMVRFKML